MKKQKGRLETRYFVLLNRDGSERDDRKAGYSRFTGSEPFHAAVKVAVRLGGTKEKPEVILLRERGTKKIYVYEVWSELVPLKRSDNTPRPAWLPDKVRKPHVRSLGHRLVDEEKNRKDLPAQSQVG